CAGNYMSNQSNNYVEIRGMTFSRGERRIFDDVSIDIPRGKVTTIMRPSGTGKTTLLRLIGGQLRPDRGTILIDGEDITKDNRRELYHMRDNMGMLFQTGALFSDLTVYEHVAFALRVHTRLADDMVRDIVLMKLN